MKDNYPVTKLVYDLQKHCVFYVLLEPIEFDDQTYIPRGFACDGASIPSYLHGLLGEPTAPEVFLGAIVHDFMYRFGCVADGGGQFWRIVSRREADKSFYKIIRRNGCSLWRAQLIYWGVRIFGVKYFNKKGG